MIDGNVAVYSVSKNKLNRLYSFDVLQEFGLNYPRFHFSANSSNFFIFNNEGILLQFCLRISPTESNTLNKYIHYQPCKTNHSTIQPNESDITLEEQKRAEASNRYFDQMEETKIQITEIYLQMKDGWNKIKELNNELPEAYRISSTEFEIDSRITTDTQTTMTHELMTMQNELYISINDIRTKCDRIRKSFLDNVEHWPFMLKGFK